MGIILADIKRCILTKKYIFIILGMMALLFASTHDLIHAVLEYGAKTGVVDMLTHSLVMDKYKTLIALLAGALYTGSFCADDNNHYLRGVLTRTDVFSYCLSRFLTNAFAIVTAMILAFLGYTAAVRALGVAVRATDYTNYFYSVAYNRPILYIAAMALQFGMVCVACSSIGLLFSTYQPDRFVSIGVCGAVFFAAVSFIPLGSAFSVLNLISMKNILPSGTSETTMYIWGMLYPLLVTSVCTFAFYKRIRRRMDAGLI